MIKFETINGKLCRILEKAIPLTEDAKMPCVVRLIQDDSPMGRLNRHYKSDTELEKYAIVSKLSDDGKLSIIGDKWNGYHIFNHEIIGYPVEEGSRWWALWQMQSGNAVCHTKAPSIKYSLPTHYVNRKVRENCTDDMSIEAWLSGADEINSGWQLYEPKPEPEHIANCKNCKHVCTNSNIDHCHMYEPKPAYAVGDWVECNGNQCLIEIIGRDLGRGNYYHFAYGFGGAYANSITRKLKPSEVIVKIGCLSGTVEKAYGEYRGTFILRRKNNERDVIWLSMLDTPTRELVESLLKAQKEIQND